MITIQPRFYRGDVDQDMVDLSRTHGRIAWDIETTGLNWSEDRIGTCQLAVAGEIAVVQLDGWTVPHHLRHLLEDPAILKIFHHAPFDLRFMAHHWNAGPTNVACTKIASKILDPTLDRREHSLKPVLQRYLAVVIDKQQQRSDWVRHSLTEAQIAYAAADVQYLGELYDCIIRQAELKGVDGLVRASYEYIPTRVKLDLIGAADVFSY